MANLVFNEEAVLNGNVFKYEQRLKSQANKYVENGAILTTYYHIHDTAVTVDRGLKDIAQLFGKDSPLRFNRIENFPLYGFGQANPNNTDETQVEDINVEGECLILPSTIVPSQYDIFVINHLRMRGFFQVTEVTFDSMKTEGYYKIKYRLQSTSEEQFGYLENQTIGEFRCQLDAIGTDLNPIIRKDDAVRRDQLKQIVNNMIGDYRAMFYNERHNCFMLSTRNFWRWFDLCGNEFMAKHSLMNPENATNVIMLHHKLNDRSFAMRYQQSLYRWIEDGAPRGNLNKFPFTTIPGTNYTESSFAKWSESDIQVIVPEPHAVHDEHHERQSIFSHTQTQFFLENGTFGSNDYDNLIKLYCNGQLDNIQQVPLTIGNMAAAGITDRQIYFLTPVIIYIIRHVLKFN